MTEATVGRWLLLIHQIPPDPAYLRVKTWRKLQKLGAVTLKNSVYLLPAGDEAREDFCWISREIRSEGGDAAVAAADFIDGLADAQIEALFREARDADYEALRTEARALGAELAAEADATPKQRDRHARLARRLAEIVAIDFFSAPGRDAAEAAVQALAARLAPPRRQGPAEDLKGLTGRVWVTRAGVQVDRIASAWLIRRFVDAQARFKFVATPYRPQPGEIRFDMFEGEVTHDGDRCTFEMLMIRGGIADPALAAIGEVIHDLDLKDDKYGRPETRGVGLILAGITAAQDDDAARIARGGAALDDLYAAFLRGAPR